MESFVSNHFIYLFILCIIAYIRFSISFFVVLVFAICGGQSNYNLFKSNEKKINNNYPLKNAIRNDFRKYFSTIFVLKL